MTRQVINIGTNANDGSGDTLRSAGVKINEMTEELYTLIDSSVLEAPFDSSEYTRYNGGWRKTNIIPDAPADGTKYVRQDSDWVPAINNPNNDGRVYGRQHTTWARAAEEANSDGSLYARKNGAWEAISIQVFDAPADGQKYVRQDSAWVVADSAVFSDAPSDGSAYARQNGSWTNISTNLAASPIDGTTYGRQNSSWVNVTPEAPQDSTPYGRRNGLWIDITPEVVNPTSPGIYGRDSSTWVAVTEEADSDGEYYTRRNGVWVPVPVDDILNPGGLPSRLYARDSNSWERVPEEALIDSVPRVRYNARWMTFDSATSLSGISVGEANSVNTFICEADSLAITSAISLFGITASPKQNYYTKTFTVGNDSTSYDFTNIWDAVAYCNEHPRSPVPHNGMTLITLDCSDYDLFDSEGIINPTFTDNQFDTHTLNFGSYDYYLRIYRLSFDSSAKIGTVRTKNAPILINGGGSPPVVIDSAGGIFETTSEASRFLLGYPSGLQFDSCSMRGKQLSIKNADDITFSDCRFDSSSQIRVVDSKLYFYASFDNSLFSVRYTRVPELWADNSTIAMAAERVFGDVMLYNSRFTLFTGTTTFYGGVGLNKSSIEISAAPDSAPSNVTILGKTSTKTSIEMFNSTFDAYPNTTGATYAIGVGEYASPPNITVQNSIKLFGSKLKASALACNFAGADRFTGLYDGSHLITDTYSIGGSGDSDSLEVKDRSYFKVSEAKPVNASFYIDANIGAGTIYSFDSLGGSPVTGPFGSMVCWDSN